MDRFLLFLDNYQIICLVKSKRQKNFLSYLYKAYMLALKSSASKSSNSDDSSTESDVLKSSMSKSSNSDVIESSTRNVDR